MTEEHAITIRAPSAIATFDEVLLQARELGNFYANLMQKGVDYDTIPGTQKPTLLKPGAEMLRLWAGLSPHFEIDSAGTDLERGIFAYTITCSLERGGEKVSEGVGSCNSLESKYRYRWASERELPDGVDKASLTKRQVTTKAGGRFYLYRIENENPQDQANTILKMAKKRAFIDAILTATGASRIFTQDVEDMVGDKHETLPQTPGPDTQTSQPQTVDVSPPGGTARGAERTPAAKAKGEWDDLRSFAGELGLLTDEAIREALGVKSIRDDLIAKGKSIAEIKVMLSDASAGRK